ncbi:UMUC-like DNA-repair protein [Heterostelium album PN500]|uniref:DNA polymerase kappa n=1 Tax=Heterostelium pallidum (strain ATCC 26659 / Pp 5 / PN500) TaxID=670386 RepID=D3BMF6_HETP5|nr:UMUC-like DNA-repair protein [Heterostelium album PN500]EFA77168.1 UMUC-like DNA-repair protein [Heterostelium album PN500]|eukprot:XP_020429297.1 UMUC-like DNA-repair protein [Heterostelium album PN500]
MEFKAGMESVDLNEINMLLEQFTEGTHFQEKIIRDELKTQQIISESLEKLKEVPDTDEYREKVDKYLEQLVESKDLTRTFLYIDMDAYYALVEEMDDPSIRGLPVAVGSMDMLVTSNYLSRKYGVRSRMPGMFALSLCPTLVIKPSRMDRYREVADTLREIYSEFDPDFVSKSLDEGCMDITKVLQNNPHVSPLEMARLCQSKIFERTTLTCGVGVAPSPLLAKLCSEVNKPNGYFVLDKDETKMKEFLARTSIKKVPGIGKLRQQLLESLGLDTIEDIYDNRYELYHLLPTTYMDILFKHAQSVPIFPEPSSFFRLKKRNMISKEKNCKEIYDEKEMDDLMKDLYMSAISTVLKENVFPTGLIIKMVDFKFKVTNHTFSLTKSAKEPVLDEDGQVLNDSLTASPMSSPGSSPKVKGSRSPIRTKDKTLTLKDNFNLIWELFVKVGKSVPFDNIRCIGLKLVNLVAIKEELDPSINFSLQS